MNEWNQLLKKVEKNPNDTSSWERIKSFADNKLNKLMDRDLRTFISDFFKNKKEELPAMIEINMDKDWEPNDNLYTYLASVLVDGHHHEELKDALNGNFDLETLSNNPCVMFD